MFGVHHRLSQAAPVLTSSKEGNNAGGHKVSVSTVLGPMSAEAAPWGLGHLRPVQSDVLWNCNPSGSDKNCSMSASHSLRWKRDLKDGKAGPCRRQMHPSPVGRNPSAGHLAIPGETQDIESEGSRSSQSSPSTLCPSAQKDGQTKKRDRSLGHEHAGRHLILTPSERHGIIIEWAENNLTHLGSLVADHLSQAVPGEWPLPLDPW